MLTASHVIESCARIAVIKQGRHVAARLASRSKSYDTALLKVPRTLGLSATFPRARTAKSNDMVFADAYDRLPGDRITRILAKARIIAPSGEGVPGHKEAERPRSRRAATPRSAGIGGSDRWDGPNLEALDKLFL